MGGWFGGLRDPGRATGCARDPGSDRVRPRRSPAPRRRPQRSPGRPPPTASAVSGAATTSTVSTGGASTGGASTASTGSTVGADSPTGGEQLALPLGERLLLRATGAAAAAGDQPGGDRLGDHLGEQRGGTDRVVVARHRVVDLVRVAVGVQHRDHRDVQLAGLADGDVLLLGVDDPHRGRDLAHVPDAAQGLGQLLLLPGEQQHLLLGAPLELAGGFHGLEVLEPLQPLVHGGEVGEHAAQPAVVDVGHVDPGRLVGDCLLGLPLGADEQDGAAVGDGLLDELERLVDVLQGLLQVDDVDAVAFGEDEPLHLRVPAPGLVSEMDTSVQHLAHGHDSHGPSFLVRRSVAGSPYGFRARERRIRLSPRVG